MKIAFMPDTHFGEYDQVEPPTPEQVADAMDHCIAEAELAENIGFDGIWVPERHQRPETWWAVSIDGVLRDVRVVGDVDPAVVAEFAAFRGRSAAELEGTDAPSRCAREVLAIAAAHGLGD